jgi:hypothetical protein
MSETGWATLLEVNSRLEAEIIKEALEAQGIPAAIFQEGAMHYVYPVAIGPLASVEICVPKERLNEAQAWLTDYESGALEEPSDTNDNEKDEE